MVFVPFLAIVQTCVIVETICFSGLPLIHNQILKNLAHYSWNIYQEKLATKCNRISWWPLWVGDPWNAHNSFCVKNYLLNLNCFQVLYIFKLSLTSKKKIFTKKMQATKKLFYIARDRRKHWKKRQKKEKWEKVKQQR